MSNALIEIIKTTGLDEEKSKYVLAQFDEFEAVAAEWETKAKAIVVTDENQTELMATAREGRLELRAKRIAVEKTRKTLKEASLREGQAIQAIANHLKGLIEPLEQHLLLQEKFIDIRENDRKDKLEEERAEILTNLGVDASIYPLREMLPEVFDRFVESTKEVIRLKKAEVERLEQDRIVKERAEAAERERIRKENEKLKAEREKQEAELAEVRKEKAEADRKTKEAEDRAEQERKDKERALRREQNAKVTKAAAAQKNKEAVLSVNEQLEIARKTITNIHQSTTETCETCLSIRRIIEKDIEQIGGWLE